MHQALKNSTEAAGDLGRIRVCRIRASREFTPVLDPGLPMPRSSLMGAVLERVSHGIVGFRGGFCGTADQKGIRTRIIKFSV